MAVFLLRNCKDDFVYVLKGSEPNPNLTTESKEPVKSPAGGLAHSSASLVIHLVYTVWNYSVWLVHLFNLNVFSLHRADPCAVSGNRVDFSAPRSTAHCVSEKNKTTCTSHRKSTHDSSMSLFHCFIVCLFFSLLRINWSTTHTPVSPWQMFPALYSIFLPLLGICSWSSFFGPGVPGPTWPLWHPRGI